MNEEERKQQFESLQLERAMRSVRDTSVTEKDKALRKVPGNCCVTSDGCDGR
jgi:hypothetical protein